MQDQIQLSTNEKAITMMEAEFTAGNFIHGKAV